GHSCCFFSERAVDFILSLLPSFLWPGALLVAIRLLRYHAAFRVRQRRQHHLSERVVGIHRLVMLRAFYSSCRIVWQFPWQACIQASSSDSSTSMISSNTPKTMRCS